MNKVFSLLKSKVTACCFWALFLAFPLVSVAYVDNSARVAEGGSINEDVALEDGPATLGEEENSWPRNDAKEVTSDSLGQIVALLEKNVVAQDRVLQALLDGREGSTNSSLEPATATFPVWTSILLGCVAVIVTTLGVGLAIFSFFGYREAMRRSSEIAENTSALIAREEIVKRMENGDFKETIEEAIDRVAFRGFQGEMEEPNDP
ncbi:MAG: hypothetical protein CL583_14615 [Alteromonadaceae bacterium]|nr:hypothetical protein [Alteromonadaceae bacterium]|tara:strand:+ start:4602 stop:5219 length:618 start_codon:yes stop_codon:yes gene_type:complete